METVQALNEQTAKIDSKLENICRKIEVTARLNPAVDHKLMFDGPNNTKVGYREYIQNFKWTNTRYSTEKTLTALIESIETTV